MFHHKLSTSNRGILTKDFYSYTSVSTSIDAFTSIPFKTPAVSRSPHRCPCPASLSSRLPANVTMWLDQAREYIRSRSRVRDRMISTAHKTEVGVRCLQSSQLLTRPNWISSHILRLWTALLLTILFSAIVLFWILYVFDLPKKPLTALSTVLFGTLFLPVFLFIRYARALFLIALPRLLSTHGRFLIYSLVFYLLTANTMETIYYNLSRAKDTGVCFINQSIEESRRHMNEASTLAINATIIPWINKLKQIYGRLMDLTGELGTTIEGYEKHFSPISSGENSSRKLNQMIISNNLTLHKFNKWLKDSRDMMESVLEMGHKISLSLKLMHKGLMCVSLVLLLLQCVLFIQRFRAGRIPFPFRMPALRTDPTIFSNLGADDPNTGSKVFTLGRNPHIMFPSNFHFCMMPKETKFAKSTASTLDGAGPSVSTPRTAWTLPKPNALNANALQPNSKLNLHVRKQAFLQSISDPAQRTHSESPMEISLGPLGLCPGGIVVPKPLPTRRIRAPLAVQEECSEMESELDELQLSTHQIEGRKLTLMPYLPPIKQPKISDSIVFKNRFTKIQQNKQIDSCFVKENDYFNNKEKMEETSISLSTCHRDKISTLPIKKTFFKFFKNITQNHRKSVVLEQKVRVRLSLLMIFRLLFFVIHLILAVFLISVDIAVYFLVDHIYTSNLHSSDQSGCHLASFETTSSTIQLSSSMYPPMTAVSSAPSKFIPSTSYLGIAKEHCSHLLDRSDSLKTDSQDALLAGTVQVLFRGRFVRVPYEVHARGLQQCLHTAVQPGTTPLLVLLLAILYVAVFFGIVVTFEFSMFAGQKSSERLPKFKHARSGSTPSSASYSELRLSNNSRHRCRIQKWCSRARISIGNLKRNLINSCITISWVNRSLCALSCRRDRIIHRYHDLKEILFRGAANISNRLGPSKRAVITAFGLSCAIIFFVLLWSLIVFDVPHAPPLYISALIFGALTYPLFVKSQYARAVVCLALPRVGTLRGRLLLYSLVFCLLSSHTLVSITINLDKASESGLCIMNRTLEDGKKQIKDSSNKALNVSLQRYINDIKRIYKAVDFLIREWSDIQNLPLTHKVNNTDASSIQVNHEVRLNQLSEWLVAWRTNFEAFITTAHAITTIIYWVNKILVIISLLLVLMQSASFINRYRLGKIHVPPLATFASPPHTPSEFSNHSSPDSGKNSKRPSRRDGKRDLRREAWDMSERHEALRTHLISKSFNLKPWQKASPQRIVLLKSISDPFPCDRIDFSGESTEINITELQAKEPAELDINGNICLDDNANDLEQNNKEIEDPKISSIQHNKQQQIQEVLIEPAQNEFKADNHIISPEQNLTTNNRLSKFDNDVCSIITAYADTASGSESEPEPDTFQEYDMPNTPDHRTKAEHSMNWRESTAWQSSLRATTMTTIASGNTQNLTLESSKRKNMSHQTEEAAAKLESRAPIAGVEECFTDSELAEDTYKPDSGLTLVPYPPPSYQSPKSCSCNRRNGKGKKLEELEEIQIDKRYKISERHKDNDSESSNGLGHKLKKKQKRKHKHHHKNSSSSTSSPSSGSSTVSCSNSFGIPISISVLVRLFILVLNVVFCTALLVFDVALYLFVNSIHKNNNAARSGSRSRCSGTDANSTILASTTQTPSTTLSINNDGSAPSARIHPSLSSDCSDSLTSALVGDAPLLEGTVEVAWLGRKVRIPFEFWVHVGDCVLAPVWPGSNPLVLAVIVIAYILVVIGIVGVLI